MDPVVNDIMITITFALFSTLGVPS
jgi:hypothetical protein